MKNVTLIKIVFIIFLINTLTFSQLYKGPKQGSISGGLILTTNSFSSNAPAVLPQEKIGRNKFNAPEEPPMEFNNALQKAALNIYVEDKSVNKLAQTDTLGYPVLLKDFEGFNHKNSIPPDPYLAAGPNHIIGIVNSEFGIWDKNGNLLKLIDANQWYKNLINGVSAFDPKVSYDHFANRWIMVWLQVDDKTETAYFLLSISDDDNPLGEWSNWALPSHMLGDSTTTNWADYEGVGFDKDAIYITSQQWSFGGSFQHQLIRIIPKEQLLDNTAGPVSWFDLYDIRIPQATGFKAFGIRPTITYDSTSTKYYFGFTSSGGSSYFYYYALEKNETTFFDTLIGYRSTVPQYKRAPDADQLGGSFKGSNEMLIEADGSQLRFEPIVKDDVMWMSFSTANPNDNSYSSIYYLAVDLNSGSIVQNEIFGAVGYWYFYPTIAVDKDYNIGISFSRSGDTEYAGAYFLGKPFEKSLGDYPAQTLQSGKANYVEDYESGRNRWGDYNGIWLDPVNQNNFWINVEYAASKDRWGTWIGEFRVAPYDSAYAHAIIDNLDFKDVEVDSSSDTLQTKISNFGSDNLIISDIHTQTNNFRILSDLSFPITLIPYDTLTLDIVFEPKEKANFSEELQIASNSVSSLSIMLNGLGYVINEVPIRNMIAGSGTNNSGKILAIDLTTGEGTEIGSSNFTNVTGLAIHPKSKRTYGFSSNSNSITIFVANAIEGDAHKLFDLPLTNMLACAFDTTGNFYAVSRNGTLYQVNLLNGSIVNTDTIKTAVSSIVFHPKTNQLWAAQFAPIGTRDYIYKVDITTGDTVRVGQTGFGVVTNDLEFDEDGNLYGIKGSSSQIGDLISIDNLTGKGTVIGSIGFQHITSLAYSLPEITSVREEKKDLTIPEEFSLSQNYPNPFNPNTTIEYFLPKDAKVKLVIYNILGEEVITLVNDHKSAGIYKINWNAKDNFGRSLSSGVYFYELRADVVDNTKFSKIQKMILLK